MFVKLVKKQQKELESLSKTHLKERSTLQKQQCTVVDKMVASHDKERQQLEKISEKGGSKKKR
jgi:phosphatidylinositol phospholipase C beta